MGKPISDDVRKRIVARYAECGNYSQVAREFNIVPNSVKNILQSDPAFAKVCKEKKEEQEKEILDHMDSKKDKVCDLIDAYLDALLDPEKIERATPSQLSTALGTVIDKFLLAVDRKQGDKNEGGVIIMPEVEQNE